MLSFLGGVGLPTRSNTEAVVLSDTAPFGEAVVLSEAEAAQYSYYSRRTAANELAPLLPAGIRPGPDPSVSRTAADRSLRLAQPSAKVQFDPELYPGKACADWCAGNVTIDRAAAEAAGRTTFPPYDIADEAEKCSWDRHCAGCDFCSHDAHCDAMCAVIADSYLSPKAEPYAWKQETLPWATLCMWGVCHDCTECAFEASHVCEALSEQAKTECAGCCEFRHCLTEPDAACWDGTIGAKLGHECSHCIEYESCCDFFSSDDDEPSGEEAQVSEAYPAAGDASKPGEAPTPEEDATIITPGDNGDTTLATAPADAATKPTDKAIDPAVAALRAIAAAAAAAAAGASAGAEAPAATHASTLTATAHATLGGPSPPPHLPPAWRHKPSSAEAEAPAAKHASTLTAEATTLADDDLEEPGSGPAPSIQYWCCGGGVTLPYDYGIAMPYPSKTHPDTNEFCPGEDDNYSDGYYCSYVTHHAYEGPVHLKLQYDGTSFKLFWAQKATRNRHQFKHTCWNSTDIGYNAGTYGIPDAWKNPEELFASSHCHEAVPPPPATPPATPPSDESTTLADDASTAEEEATASATAMTPVDDNATDTTLATTPTDDATNVPADEATKLADNATIPASTSPAEAAKNTGEGSATFISMLARPA